ncbi:UDP-glucosyltransferase 2-like [Homalodisca vitripennis]|uniref:UDP-glucosyltransferase 2-like n=1 Tax=Homalodisca vitripennis TaxID=197043 RepID=UPI001EEB84DF|nr:UDP-glucosyltransferase 2-like [Homalodisca vitripennis]
MLEIHLVTILFCMGMVNSANILMLTLGGTKSHKVPFLALGQGLVSRGHQVTLVSAFPKDGDSPVEEVSPLGLVLYVRNFTNWDLLGPKLRGEEAVSIIDVIRYSYQVCDAFYSTPEARLLLSRKTDLLVLDGAYPECLLGLAHHFGVPFIYLNTVAFYTTHLSLAGNPTMFSVTPYMDYPHSDRMDFWERSKNGLFHLLSRGMLVFATKFFVEPVIRQHLGGGAPPVHSIGRNVSLILQHGHHSVTYPRPLLPGVVEVACLHCRPARPLTEDLEKFVTSGKKKGFVYVSFGTSIKTTQMPEIMRVLMVKAFSELPYQVLWKYEDEGDSMPDLPDNVRLSRWLPQQDLLGHSKIRAFVSHGGLHGVMESIYHAVPMVNLPVFCDHAANSFKAEREGISVSLNFRDLNVESFLAAINRVINDISYKKNVQYRSLLLRDQPEPPLDRALYWVQYVLRHHGATQHLQSPAKDLSLTQYFMLDTIMMVAGAVYISWVIC